MYKEVQSRSLLSPLKPGELLFLIVDHRASLPAWHPLEGWFSEVPPKHLSLKSLGPHSDRTAGPFIQPDQAAQPPAMRDQGRDLAVCSQLCLSIAPGSLSLLCLPSSAHQTDRVVCQVSEFAPAIRIMPKPIWRLQAALQTRHTWLSLLSKKRVREWERSG